MIFVSRLCPYQNNTIRYQGWTANVDGDPHDHQIGMWLYDIAYFYYVMYSPVISDVIDVATPTEILNKQVIVFYIEP